VVVCPIQIVELLTDIAGNGLAITVTVVVIEHPNEVPVTL
jgi:hypothetical protein